MEGLQERTVEGCFGGKSGEKIEEKAVKKEGVCLCGAPAASPCLGPGRGLGGPPGCRCPLGRPGLSSRALGHHRPVFQVTSEDPEGPRLWVATGTPREGSDGSPEGGRCCPGHREWGEAGGPASHSLPPRAGGLSRWCSPATFPPTRQGAPSALAAAPSAWQTLAEGQFLGQQGGRHRRRGGGPRGQCHPWV